VRIRVLGDGSRDCPNRAAENCAYQASTKKRFQPLLNSALWKLTVSTLFNQFTVER
jgi:hypothetical protein